MDDIVSTTKFNELVEQRACEIAIRSDRPNDQKGIKLNPLKLKMENNSWKYSAVKVDLDLSWALGK